MSEWISVKDKLPDYDQNVLVYYEEERKSGTIREITIAFVSSITMGANYKNVEWQSIDEYRRINPTHWMPLPAPPKETEK